jgi:hypothetical protein
MAFQFSITSFCLFQKYLHGKGKKHEAESSNVVSLSSNTLADLFQFFSILSDLKCYRSTFSSFYKSSFKCKAKGAAKKEH